MRSSSSVAGGAAAVGDRIFGAGRWRSTAARADRAVIAYLAIALAWTAAAMAAFGHAFVLPLFGPFIAGLCTAAVTIGYRFVVSDKDKRFLRKALHFTSHPPRSNG